MKRYAYVWRTISCFNAHSDSECWKREIPLIELDTSFRAENVVIWLTDLFEYIMEAYKVNVDIPYKNFLFPFILIFHYLFFRSLSKSV